MRHFETFAWKTGKLTDGSPEFPFEFWAIDGSWRDIADRLPRDSAVFGYQVAGGPSLLTHLAQHYSLTKDHFFVASRWWNLHTFDGAKVILIARKGTDAPFLMGGPIEFEGRLKYIDGCTDSLLLPPWKKGEPCLNHLHFPAGINQTEHTHPSDRLGVIVRGRGWCDTPDGTFELRPGMLWRIPAGGVHKFRTESEYMDVIAFHPDSDFGPEDENHPMINRTIVNGVSASLIPEIQTR